MDGAHELVCYVSTDQAAAADHRVPVLVIDGEHAQLLADARDLSERLERRSAQPASDSLRLALSLMQHIVELIETTHDRGR